MESDSVRAPEVSMEVASARSILELAPLDATTRVACDATAEAEVGQ